MSKWVWSMTFHSHAGMSSFLCQKPWFPLQWDVSYIDSRFASCNKIKENDIKVEIIQDLILYHYHIKKRNSPILKTLLKSHHVQKEK